MSIAEPQGKSPVQEKGQVVPEAPIEGWGWGSIGLNVILSLLNLGIALASGSLAVAAEMVHNLVDLIASVAVLVGLKISKRKSKSFPYGLYKVENLVAVGVALLIFFTGFEIVRQALFAPTRETSVNLWMLAGVLLSILLPMIFSSFEMSAGKAANSPSLIADAQEYRVHVLTSGLVLISLAGSYFGLRLDRIAALCVAVFILKAGWELLRDGMRVLLDASLDAETLAQVRQIIEKDPATVQVKALRGRNSGRYRFLEAEVTLRVDDLKKAHTVSQRIERTIRAEVPHLERVLIHYEPEARPYAIYAFPLADVGGKLSEHFGEAPYFALVTLRLSDGEIEQQAVLTNPHTDLPKAKGIRVAEWLVSQKVDHVVLKENIHGKGPEYVFADAGVEVSFTAADTVSLALDELGR